MVGSAKNATAVGRSPADHGGEIGGERGGMYGLAATTLGAWGGLIREAVAFLKDVDSWRQARREHRAAGKRGRRPRFSSYVDILADTAVAATRLALRALAGYLLHGQFARGSPRCPPPLPFPPHPPPPPPPRK